VAELLAAIKTHLGVTGDTFVLSKERFEEINSTKFGVLVKAVAKEAAKPKKKPKKG
jgi:hypothetical protein